MITTIMSSSFTCLPSIFYAMYVYAATGLWLLKMAVESVAPSYKRGWWVMLWCHCISKWQDICSFCTNTKNKDYDKLQGASLCMHGETKAAAENFAKVCYNPVLLQIALFLSDKVLGWLISEGAWVDTTSLVSVPGFYDFWTLLAKSSVWCSCCRSRDLWGEPFLVECWQKSSTRLERWARQELLVKILHTPTPMIFSALTNVSKVLTQYVDSTVDSTYSDYPTMEKAKEIESIVFLR